MGTIISFRNYAIWIIGFFIISVILENALIAYMYKPIAGTTDGNLIMVGKSNTDLEVTVTEAKATNINGYVILEVKNITGKYLEKCCAKVELYTERNVLALTKYIDVSNFEVNETKSFKINFKGQYVANYEVTLVEDAPDESYSLNLFGIIEWSKV